MPRSVAELLAHADELADSFENKFEPSRPAEVTGLGELYLAVQDRAASERRLHKAVGAARDDGTSWAVIGRMLGTTGEAARQRFGTATKTTKKTAKAVPAKTATTKATPAKKATKSSGHGLAASADRRQPTGRTTNRVTGKSTSRASGIARHH